MAPCESMITAALTRPLAHGLIEEKTRNGILCTPSVNSPRKQCMSFRQRSVTYVKSFLRAFTREKRYPTCFKFRFVSSPHLRELGIAAKQLFPKLPLVSECGSSS